jgi:hypothetical protein
VLEPSILIAACALAAWGDPAATIPTNSAGTNAFCHDFMNLTLWNERGGVSKDCKSAEAL